MRLRFPIAVLLLALVAIAAPRDSAAGHPARRAVRRLSQHNPPGAPRDQIATQRCGPAVLAMVARGFRHGDPMSPEALIQHFDLLDGKSNQPTTFDELRGATWEMPVTTAFVDLGSVAHELERGGLVVALGRMPRGTGGHYVLLDRSLGDHRFSLLDPGPPQGTVQRTPIVGEAEIGAFVRRQAGGRLLAIRPQSW